MTFLKKIFPRKINLNKQNFSKIISNAEYLIVYLPNDSFIAYNIIRYILNWNSYFPNIIAYTNRYNFDFFKTFAENGSIKFALTEKSICENDKAVVFNLARTNKLEQLLSGNLRAVILDINDNSNLKFIPKPANEMTLLEKFAEFTGLDFSPKEIPIQPKPDHTQFASLIKNKFPNFILDINTIRHKYKIKNLISSLKKQYSANIYLTGKKPGKNDFVNVKTVGIKNLAALFSLSHFCDLLITDDVGIARIFSKYKINLLLIDNIGVNNMKQISLQDADKLKSSIPDLLAKDNSK